MKTVTLGIRYSDQDEYEFIFKTYYVPRIGDYVGLKVWNKFDIRGIVEDVQWEYEIYPNGELKIMVGVTIKPEPPQEETP